MAIPLDEWVTLLEGEYLNDFVAKGGAAVKLAVAPHPGAVNRTLYRVAEVATPQGFLTVWVNAAETRVQMIQNLFYAAARATDWDTVAERWLRRRFARSGYTVAEEMPLIEAKGLLLHPPSPEQVRQTYEQVRALYAAAYPSAPAPREIQDALEYAASTRMREYVRAWINLWDLHRLYGHVAHLVTETLQVALTEDKDLQASADEKAPLDEIFVDD